MTNGLFTAAQNGRHEEFLTVLASHQHSGFMVAGLVAVVDDVGGIVSKLLFLTEISVMYYGVDVADGAVEPDLVEVVVTARVVQVEQAAVLQRLGQDIVRKPLLGQILQNHTFINIVESVQIELLVLESYFVVCFQGVVVAVRAEHNLSVIEGEYRIEVGVIVIGDLFQRVRKQVVDVNVGFAHAGGGEHDLAALVGIRE